MSAVEVEGFLADNISYYLADSAWVETALIELFRCVATTPAD